ncbi:hypothetical protein NP233_g11450 [Leucocoprinus birnbaumii]|uniref:Uncharacterized protein n=1 Tax=Leucocoprinus birnbaumii TaxID=56174 RepID=A0AAD5VK40_9AGAR|nr:hypothetical protein NP233_g11450 [Leucocoprinus birnbaumii]
MDVPKFDQDAFEANGVVVLPQSIKAVEVYCSQQFCIPVGKPRRAYIPFVPRYRRRWSWRSVIAKVKASKIKKRMPTNQTTDLGKEINNLKTYHHAKQHFVDTATTAEKDYFSGMADEANRKKRSPPTLKDVLLQQDEILSAMYDQVEDCLGWEPGQFGNGLCLLAVAVRGNDGRIKADATLVSNAANPEKHGRTGALYNRYKKDMKSSFELVANELLPLHSETVEKNPDLFLSTRGAEFPILNVDLMSLKESRKLLRQFIVFVWEQSGSEEHPRLGGDLPWRDLDSGVGRQKLLVNSEPFQKLSSFDPNKMTLADVKDTVRSIGGVPNILAFIPEARVQSKKPSSVASMSPSSIGVSERQASKLLSRISSPSPSRSGAVEQPALVTSYPPSTSLIVTADLTASERTGGTTVSRHSRHDRPSTPAVCVSDLLPTASALSSRENSPETLSSEGAYNTTARPDETGKTDVLNAPVRSSESVLFPQENIYYEKPRCNRKRKRSNSNQMSRVDVANESDNVTSGTPLSLSTTTVERRERRWRNSIFALSVHGRVENGVRYAPINRLASSLHYS